MPARHTEERTPRPFATVTVQETHTLLFHGITTEHVYTVLLSVEHA